MCGMERGTMEGVGAFGLFLEVPLLCPHAVTEGQCSPVLAMSLLCSLIPGWGPWPWHQHFWAAKACQGWEAQECCGCSALHLNGADGFSVLSQTGIACSKGVVTFWFSMWHLGSGDSIWVSWTPGRALLGAAAAAGRAHGHLLTSHLSENGSVWAGGENKPTFCIEFSSECLVMTIPGGYFKYESVIHVWMHFLFYFFTCGPSFPCNNAQLWLFLQGGFNFLLAQEAICAQLADRRSPCLYHSGAFGEVEWGDLHLYIYRGCV